MKREAMRLWAGLLMAGLVGGCSASPAATQPPAAPTEAMVVLGGEHAPIQMDLVGTLTASPKPLGQVRGVALNQDGELFAVDGLNSRVLKFDPTGKFLMQWGSAGKADGQFDMNGTSQNTSGFVAVDSIGNVFVTEDNRVQKFDRNGKFLTKWGTQGAGDGQFEHALAIAIDRQDSIYVVDIDNNVVQKFDESGQFLLKWGGKGAGAGQFSRPAAVAIDPQGNVLVADVDASRIQKFDSNGKFLSQVYLGAVDGLFMGAIALAVGDQDQLYIGEYAHGRVVEFDSTGKLLAAWGNTGTREEQMSEAGGLALGKDGTVYVADAFNHRVLIFGPH
jgi:tripartite motif-containing protein 71